MSATVISDMCKAELPDQTKRVLVKELKLLLLINRKFYLLECLWPVDPGKWGDRYVCEKGNIVNVRAITSRST